MSFNLTNVGELNCKGLYLSIKKNLSNRCLCSCLKNIREIWQFHVLVVQRRQRNEQKKDVVLLIQTYCFFAVLVAVVVVVVKA